jgi:hypothetical protein
MIMFNPRRKRCVLLVPAFVLLAILAGTVATQAQEVAIAQATANVLAVLTVTATHDLVFGDVLQGVPHTASKTVVADAAVFQVSGEGGQEIAMDLQLPEYLWNSTNTDRLAIDFDIDDADIDTTAAGTPAAHGLGAIVDQDPYNLPNTALGGADNILQIFLGGTVYPTVDQAASTYTADIILTVAYTGN